MVILEAMASGVVTIATNNGGTVDIIKNGKTGFLIPPANREKIIDAVFTDTNHINITEEGWHLESAETDAQGIVTVPNESDILSYIDQARIQNLIQRHATKIIIRGKLNTYNANSGQFIKILGDYSMGVQIAVKLDFEASTNNN